MGVNLKPKKLALVKKILLINCIAERRYPFDSLHDSKKSIRSTPSIRPGFQNRQYIGTVTTCYRHFWKCSHLWPISEMVDGQCMSHLQRA